MKNNIFKKVFLTLAAVVGLTSCDDREIINVDKADSPIVVNLSSNKLFLDSNFPDNPALTVSWSSAGYTIPTEANYTVQVASENTFKDAITLGGTKQSITAASFTTNQVNNAAISAGLEAFKDGTLYLRVISSLNGGALSATSNVTSFVVRPYKTIYPTFYLVGAASYVGWTATAAQALYSNDAEAVIYTYLEKDNNFRFLGQQDWNPINYSIDADGIKDEYKYFASVSDTNIKKADGDNENMNFFGDTGIYKLVINAKDKTLKATASAIPGFDIPQVYLVGNVAGNGWSAANAIEMTKVSTGVFEYTTTLASDAEFKFLGQKDWADLEWGNILKDNAGNSGFLGPKGDNGNIKFDGAGNTYKITVNIKAGIYTIVKQ